MRGETAPNEKFNKARAFMLEHSEVSSTIPNWKKMSWRTLYAAMAMRGAKWDSVSRTWFTAIDTSTAPRQKIKVAPRHTNDHRETVLVRIIASPDAINKAVSEMLDIAAASDMILLHNSGVRHSRDGRSRMVYLKFLLEDRPRK